MPSACSGKGNLTTLSMLSMEADNKSWLKKILVTEWIAPRILPWHQSQYFVSCLMSFLQDVSYPATILTATTNFVLSAGHKATLSPEITINCHSVMWYTGGFSWGSSTLRSNNYQFHGVFNWIILCLCPLTSRVTRLCEIFDSPLLYV